MFDEAYKSYVKKCKEFGINPSSKEVMFGGEIDKEQNANRVSISELSEARKTKPPKKVQTADEKRLKRNARSKAYYHKTKIATPKKEPLIEDERKDRGVIARKKYYEKNREKILARKRAKNAEKPKRVLFTDEQKKERAKERARLYHLKMKDDPAYKERKKANHKRHTDKNKEKRTSA